MKAIVTAALLCTGAASAMAQSATPIPDTLTPSGWRGLFGMELAAGGDKLVSLRYTDGTSANVRAGEGVVLKGGLEYRVNPQLRLVSTLGLHIKRSPQADVQLTFNRFPLELVASYAVQPDFEIGVGLRKALAPRLKASGSSGFPTLDPKSSVGAVVQAEWLLSQKMSFTLRYVHETYDFSGDKSSGDHIGVGFNSYF